MSKVEAGALGSFNQLFIDRLECGDPDSILDWLDDFRSSLCVKSVLWLLSNTNWTVKDLTRFFEGEFKPSRIVRPVEACSEVSSEKISELAYLLAESEGFPEGQNERFWNEAVLRLTPSNWKIESGELLVSGYGDLDSVLCLAYAKANNDCLSLNEYTCANLVGSDDYVEITFPTQKQLERLGFWS
jgi:hypothetical protein